MLELFKNNKILLAYYGGSKAYKTETDKSDTDIIVVLDDLNGAMHQGDEERHIEYYVFGKDYFLKKMEFSDEVTPYLKLFNDDILTAEQPIVLDDSFKSTYEELRSRDFSIYINKYLEAVISYFRVFLENDSLKKNMYHLYRIEEQIRRYLETGEFRVEISEDTLEKILVFKENYQSNSQVYLNELRNILNYLKEVKINVTS